jgi:hypothetical protein
MSLEDASHLVARYGHALLDVRQRRGRGVRVGASTQCGGAVGVPRVLSRRAEVDPAHDLRHGASWALRVRMVGAPRAPLSVE